MSKKPTPSPNLDNLIDPGALKQLSTAQLILLQIEDVTDKLQHENQR